MSAIITPAGQANPGRLLHITRAYAITIMAAISTLVLLAVPSAASMATWLRPEPLSLQIWISHLSHWSGGHLFWDLLMFVVTAAVIERFDRKLLIRLLIAAPPIIICATWLFEDHTSYRGLSGLDCSLYASLIIVAFRRNWINIPFMLLFLSLLTGKCVVEIVLGAPLFVSDLPGNVTSVPWAHIAGTAAGLLIALFSANSSPENKAQSARRL